MIHLTTRLFLVGLLLAPAGASAITIPTVPVGNAGNPGEISGISAGSFGPDAIVGGVSYEYRIGTTEVTNTQYVAFLNAKAASDPYHLYNPRMAGTYHPGILRNGTSGSYTYAPIPGRENQPVTYVSWYDGIRFANWLHNGQGDGDTETGAYTLGALDAEGIPINGDSITRNPGAKWFMPSEDEWYKAAYHKNDGVTGNYFDYPTSSDDVPTDELPPGGTNSANYIFKVGDVSDVGAYTGSASPYGTFDQAGNVWEWNETWIEWPEADTSGRGYRGGSYEQSSASFLRAATRGYIFATAEGRIGLRVATVPEPSTAVLGIFALLGLIALGDRRRR